MPLRYPGWRSGYLRSQPYGCFNRFVARISREPFPGIPLILQQPLRVHLFMKGWKRFSPCTPFTVKYPGDRVSCKELPALKFMRRVGSETEPSKGRHDWMRVSNNFLGNGFLSPFLFSPCNLFLKRPGYLSCGDSHSLGFSDCISLMSSNTPVLYISSKLLVRPGGLGSVL